MFQTSEDSDPILRKRLIIAASRLQLWLKMIDWQHDAQILSDILGDSLSFSSPILPLKKNCLFHSEFPTKDYIINTNWNLRGIASTALSLIPHDLVISPFSKIPLNQRLCSPPARCSLVDRKEGALKPLPKDWSLEVGKTDGNLVKGSNVFFRDGWYTCVCKNLKSNMVFMMMDWSLEWNPENDFPMIGNHWLRTNTQLTPVAYKWEYTLHAGAGAPFFHFVWTNFHWNFEAFSPGTTIILEESPSQTPTCCQGIWFCLPCKITNKNHWKFNGSIPRSIKISEVSTHFISWVTWKLLDPPCDQQIIIRSNSRITTINLINVAFSVGRCSFKKHISPLFF